MKKLILIVLLLFVVYLVMEIYCRRPDQFKITKLDIPSDTQTLVLLFHGAKGHLNPELKALATQFEIYLDSHQNTEVINYNWSFASNNRLRASTNAMKIGEFLGSEIANLKVLKNIRLIAHSVGAFIPDALCQAYRDHGGDAHIEINFLDPFNLRGFADMSYGVRSHGKCADFASSTMNTDDPAPTTNTMLKNAWNLDVTSLDRPLDFKRSSHYWPPLYFLLSMNEDMARMGLKTHKEFPRGEIIQAVELSNK